MSLSKTTKIANRLGLNLKFYKYGATAEAELMDIKFANEVSIEVSRDVTWATGGQHQDGMIPFEDPIEGTMKISTQVVTPQVLKLAAGQDISDAGTMVSFANNSTRPHMYKIKGETVWVGDDGNTYSESIAVYKACIKPSYKPTFKGEGDPQSIDIEFDLMADADGKVVDFDLFEACVITFDSQGGDAVPALQTRVGATVTLPEAKRDGYTFEGWYIDAKYATQFAQSDAVTGDMTVYAKWTKKD